MLGPGCLNSDEILFSIFLFSFNKHVGDGSSVFRWSGKELQRISCLQLLHLFLSGNTEAVLSHPANKGFSCPGKEKGLAGPQVSHQPPHLPSLWVVGRVCCGSPEVSWPSGWLSGGQSFNPYPHPNAAMEPQHTVCGPGSGKRRRGKGLGGEEKAAPHNPHMIPNSCYGLKLSSDLHFDLAIFLERFV